MKMLHVTDFHGHLPWYQWTARQAARYDLVALTGDLIDDTLSVSTEEQICVVRSLAAQLESKLLICGGNHDARELDPPHGYHDWLPDLRRHTLGSGESVIDFRGLRIGYLDWGDAPMWGDLDLLLSHQPPARCGPAIAEPEGIDWGDLSLRDYLDAELLRPRLVFSGHVHRPRRWAGCIKNTVTLNPGQAPSASAVPAHIEVDLLHRTLHWHSGTGLVDGRRLPE
ncbi:metallophosphoesterase family protein [Actomonas aquatica]|uniref:Metallophosphoesterase family protein n=1 Tax=Actomonas aquatica TaxID=2866162 RepID=A0ABZ1CE94_9BACT|nr:metallophosphoesterase [Opitutus sp. WL0086]WRQ88605.1 metallophosphoesterase family protein [Opitutus sp. WL0086]